MIIKLYKNLSDKNHVDKTISQMGNDLTGFLRDDCSIINPVIQIENYQNFDFSQVNYAYIPEFKRYYYINNITLKNKMFELSMHVDVLMTYKNEIRTNNAVISRQERNYNLYLQDGVFKTYAFSHIQIVQFPDGFSNFNYIFSVAG